ncbi:hypothetical protein HaLaN_05436, partial [Haematococcus lacustris]
MELASGVFEHLALPPGNVVMVGPIDTRLFMREAIQTRLEYENMNMGMEMCPAEGRNQLEALVSPDGWSN